MTVETPCPQYDCCEADPFSYSITSGKTYLNNESSFIFSCPPGFVCEPGAYPHTIIIPGGTIPWQPPPPFTSPLRLMGCSSEIVENVPTGATQADFDAIVQDMLQQAAAQLAGCEEADYRKKNARLIVSNTEQTVSCPTGETLNNHGFKLPPGVTISGNSLVLAPGVFTERAASQAQSDLDAALAKVNAEALKQLTALFNRALLAGTLSCDSGPPPAAPCSLFVPDNTQIGDIILTTTGVSPPTGLAGSFANMEPGDYKLTYISGSYSLAHCNFDPLCLTMNPAIPAAFFVTTTDGLNPNISAVGEIDGSFGYFPQGNIFLTEAAAKADYLTRNGSMPTIAVGRSKNQETIGINLVDSVCDYLSQSEAGPFTAGPTIRATRIIKLINPEPETVTITTITSFANSRFTIGYSSQVTSGIALDALAAVVQAALNALPAIIADGGVVCAGAIDTGITVTWNNNGARTMLDPRVVTDSPGWTCNIVETQAGNAGLPEIQTLIVDTIAVDFNQNPALPAFNGATTVRNLNTKLWNIPAVAFPAVSQVSGIEFYSMEVQLVCGPDAPSSAPTVANTGPGNIPAGTHSWAITFDNSSLDFNSGSGPGPLGTLLLAGNSAVQLTNIPLGPAGTTARNIYRTRVGSTTLRLVGTIADNTTTVFNDNVDDATIKNPVNPSSHWWSLVIQCVLAGPVPLPVWAGYKLTGLDPIGTYQSYALYYEDIPGASYNHDRGIQTLDLFGTF